MGKALNTLANRLKLPHVNKNVKRWTLK